MKNEKTEKLRAQIREYIRELNGNVFPNKLKDRVSVFLSGSTGWGITEGFDSKADWDLHLILSDEDYEKFVEVYGKDGDHTTYVLVDPDKASRILEEHIGNGQIVEEYTINAVRNKEV